MNDVEKLVEQAVVGICCFGDDESFGYIERGANYRVCITPETDDVFNVSVVDIMYAVEVKKEGDDEGVILECIAEKDLVESIEDAINRYDFYRSL
jgi:hypothetical protein